MSFLDPNYKVPESTGGYMKLKQGKNKFRILSPAITGYEYWNTENKPIRAREPFETLPEDIKKDKDGTPSNIKHFWAFVVWNYADKAVQILELTQATIQRGLKIKIDNREGKATENDFIVTRSGSDLLTEYDIDVSEAAPLAPEIQDAYDAKKINLEALYTGADPFKVSPDAQNAPVTNENAKGGVSEPEYKVPHFPVKSDNQPEPDLDVESIPF